jgi:hypothetical protein
LAVTTNLARPLSPTHIKPLGDRYALGGLLVSALLAGGVFYLARLNEWWPVAVMLVLAVELWALRASGSRVKMLLERAPAILVGAATALIIAVSIRQATQIAFAVLYAVWRWQSVQRPDLTRSLPNLLFMQALLLQGLFLVAAEWRGEQGVPEWVVLLLIWLGSYLAVYATLSSRQERAAGVMAATWALVAAEISWVLLRWLHVYTLTGGYLLVPLPVLILTGIGYCYGSIYQSQRQGKLSRARLAEYIFIGLILIAIVVFGTPWRGNL